MKKFIFKKTYSNFNPVLHWNIILASSCGVFLVSIAYASYLYIYSKTEINTPITDTSIASSTELASSTKAIQNIEGVLDIYKKKSDRYEILIGELKSSQKNILQVSTTTTTGTATAIATSEKR